MSSRSSRKTPASFVEDYSDATVESWVETFCRKRGNEYYCEVPDDFMLDKFNLTNLGIETNQKLEDAYDLITDRYVGDVDEHGNLPAGIETMARKLYGLIHQRYLQTPQGINHMQKKYTHGVFGNCPRVLCEAQGLLPMGLSDRLGVDSVKLYCMRCEDIYLPKSTAHNSIDGAVFGTSFPQLYILSNKIELEPYAERVRKFVSRIFGFKLASPELIAQVEELEKSKVNA